MRITTGKQNADTQQVRPCILVVGVPASDGLLVCLPVFCAKLETNT